VRPVTDKQLVKDNQQAQLDPVKDNQEAQLDPVKDNQQAQLDPLKDNQQAQLDPVRDKQEDVHLDVPERDTELGAVDHGMFELLLHLRRMVGYDHSLLQMQKENQNWIQLAVCIHWFPFPVWLVPYNLVSYFQPSQKVQKTQDLHW
jgi:hypothetical protein